MCLQVLHQLIYNANADSTHIGLLRLHELAKRLNVRLKQVGDRLRVRLGDGCQRAAHLVQQLIVPLRLLLLSLLLVVVIVLVLPRVGPPVLPLQHLRRHCRQGVERRSDLVRRPEAPQAPVAEALVEGLDHGTLDLRLRLLDDARDELLKDEGQQVVDEPRVAQPAPEAHHRRLCQLGHQGRRRRPDVLRVEEGEEGDHDSGDPLDVGEHSLLELRKVAHEHVARRRLLLERGRLDGKLLGRPAVLALHDDGRDALLLVVLVVVLLGDLHVGLDVGALEEGRHHHREVGDEVVPERLGQAPPRLEQVARLGVVWVHGLALRRHELVHDVARVGDKDLLADREADERDALHRLAPEEAVLLGTALDEHLLEGGHDAGVVDGKVVLDAVGD
mmetsp:Transcript_39781/g.99567  ORF Transcript_39781/g.99567 Transcript_39781/m.99567 type:complete len:389 (-) Transcript_39781:1692-2858(-)